jgi:sigma-B regulation protein RsbU (phosphoserine phosphatase)
MLKTHSRNVPGGVIRWRHRIAVRLTVVFLSFTALIFGATLGYNYYQARAMITDKLEVTARHLVTAAAGRVETVITSVTCQTESMARSLETFPHTRTELLAFINTSVLAHPDVFGSAVAFEPSDSGPVNDPYAPYFYRTPQGTSYLDLAQSYDYATQDWFQIPRELGQTEWSEPYFDEGGGNALMATCSVPFYESDDGQKRFSGIVTSDISLTRLTDIVSSITVLKTGYGFLLSRNGTFLAHPNRDLIINESLFSIAEMRDNRELRDMGRRMIAGESGFIAYKTLSGVDSWMYYAPIRPVGWTLAVIFPKDELFADIRALTLAMAGMGLFGLLLLTLVIMLIARSITTPIRALARATGKIAEGDFEAPLPGTRSKDEVGGLTRDFRVMRDSLNDHIKQLTETTAARERMESELQIAHDIQMSILPKIFPPFPTRDEFDLFALIEPAKEVGGDFYDFFQISDTQLCFVVGDVSGKGVPAALFMAVTKTLIKSFAREKEHVTPEAILTHVNEELAADNDACMFVTLFCGILDTTKGDVHYANAGHNPPLVIKHNGDVTWLPRAKSLMAGPMPGVQYTREHLSLSPGDSLFLYTDGVTEAMNPSDELFSEDRLERDLAAVANRDIREGIQAVMASIRRFTDGAAQSDDITMMMIRYSGVGK